MKKSKGHGNRDVAHPRRVRRGIPGHFWKGTLWTHGDETMTEDYAEFIGERIQEFLGYAGAKVAGK